MTTAVHPSSVHLNEWWKRLAFLLVAVVLVGGGAMVVAATVNSQSAPSMMTPSEKYYASVMHQYGQQTTNASSYAWMMGGSMAPGWMTGQSLPTMMTSKGNQMMSGGAQGVGAVMGRLWAKAPTDRVSQNSVTTLAGKVPTGASVDKQHNSIAFAAQQVQFTAVASVNGANAFSIAGLTNPSITVPVGSHVSIQFVNAAVDSAHGLVVTDSVSNTSMPMMNARSAFPGASAWFLGDATNAGAQTTTMTFDATSKGTFEYLSPVPGQQAMAGSFTVAGTGEPAILSP